MAGTIKVDIDALTTLLLNVSLLKSSLDLETKTIPSLSTQLNAAITGTASSIADFESKFSDWVQLLNTLTSDIDSAYSTLNNVLTDAQNAVHAL